MRGKDGRKNKGEPQQINAKFEVFKVELLSFTILFSTKVLYPLKKIRHIEILSRLYSDPHISVEITFWSLPDVELQGKKPPPNRSDWIRSDWIRSERKINLNTDGSVPAHLQAVFFLRGEEKSNLQKKVKQWIKQDVFRICFSSTMERFLCPEGLEHLVTKLF